MKTITLMLAAVAMTFAQAPAQSSPAAPKDAASATTTASPVKKHSKKHASKKIVTPAPAVTAAPASK